MLTQTSKNANRRHVHKRIRKKILGTAERPRLNVYRSLNHIYVQLIDDLQGRDPGFRELRRRQKGRAAHRRQPGCGEERRQEHRRARQGQGDQKVVFDRGGYIYHGRVKALADSAREAGLQF